MFVCDVHYSGKVQDHLEISLFLLREWVFSVYSVSAASLRPGALRENEPQEFHLLVE